MALRLSTGLVDKMMTNNPFRVVMNLCFIDVYTGSRPAAPDDAIPAGSVKLVTISNNSTATGLTFAAASVVGVIQKAAAEVWSGVNVIGGVAGFARMREAGDPGTALSTTAARADLTVGTSGADMNISSTVLVAAAPTNVSSAQFTLPRGL